MNGVRTMSFSDEFLTDRFNQYKASLMPVSKSIFWCLAILQLVHIVIRGLSVDLYSLFSFILLLS